jgi:hypothetical protein
MATSRHVSNELVVYDFCHKGVEPIDITKNSFVKTSVGTKGECTLSFENLFRPLH